MKAAIKLRLPGEPVIIGEEPLTHYDLLALAEAWSSGADAEPGWYDDERGFVADQPKGATHE